MDGLHHFFKSMLTGPDNHTYDIGRVLWFHVTLVYTFLSFYHIVYHNGTFNAVEWGTGIAAILGAGGAAVGLKANAEPKVPTPLPNSHPTPPTPTTPPTK